MPHTSNQNTLRAAFNLYRRSAPVEDPAKHVIVLIDSGVHQGHFADRDMAIHTARRLAQGRPFFIGTLDREGTGEFFAP